jgi:hypothetical protein
MEINSGTQYIPDCSCGEKRHQVTPLVMVALKQAAALYKTIEHLRNDETECQEGIQRAVETICQILRSPGQAT